jgi:hypothetical protein
MAWFGDRLTSQLAPAKLGMSADDEGNAGTKPAVNPAGLRTATRQQLIPDMLPRRDQST